MNTDFFGWVAQLITSPLGAWAACGIIIAIANFYWLKFRKSINRRIKNLQEAIIKLNEMDDMNGFAADYRDFSGWAKAHSMLGHAWREFEESLVFPDPTDEEQYICNTQDACCFFNAALIDDKTTNLSFYKALPNYLTGLGILGTFLGLVCGIYLAGHGLASEDPALLKDALRQLLEGASLAFWTSIAGLATSMLFSAYEKRKLNEVNSALEDWNEALDKRIKRITPEYLASQQLKQLKEQTTHLETFVNQIAVNIADAVDQRMNGTLVPVLERLADTVDSMRTDHAEHNMPVLVRLADTVEAMRDNHEERNEDMLREVVDTFKTTMTGAAGREMEALSGTLNQLQTTLIPIIQEMQTAQTAMQKASGDMTAQMNSFYEQSNREFAAGIAQVTETIGASVREARQLLHDDLSTAFGQTATRMEEATTAITERLGASYEEYNRSLSGNIEACGRTLASNIEECSQSLTANMAEASAQIGETVRSAGELLGGQLQGAFTQAAERMHEAVRAIEGTVEKVRQSGEASGDAADRTGVMLTQLSDLMERLGDHQRSVEQASAAIRQTASSLTDTGSALAQAASTTTGSATVLRSASEQIRATQQTLEGVWKEYEQRFKGVDESLEKVFVRLSENHKAFCDSTTDYMTQLDANVGKISSDIGASVNAFGDSIEELADALNKVRR